MKTAGRAPTHSHVKGHTHRCLMIEAAFGATHGKWCWWTTGCTLEGNNHVTLVVVLQTTAGAWWMFVESISVSWNNWWIDINRRSLEAVDHDYCKVLATAWHVHLSVFVKCDICHRRPLGPLVVAVRTSWRFSAHISGKAASRPRQFLSPWTGHNDKWNMMEHDCECVRQSTNL